MKSIADKTECASAAIQFKKPVVDVKIKDDDFGEDKPTGCSWYDLASGSGYLDLWRSSSGKCDVGGYSGCFCKKIHQLDAE